MSQILGQSVVVHKQNGHSHRGPSPQMHEGPHMIIEETTIKQTELVGNLKRELDKALKELSAKDYEIKSILKQTRATKYKELDVSFINH